MSAQTDSKIITHGFSWSFAEKLLTEIVNFIVTIFLSRLLLPDDYGAVAIIQIFINISSVFSGSGLGVSIIQKKDASDEQLSTIFYFNLLIGILIYSALFIISPLIANIYKNSKLTSFMRVLAIKIPLVCIYNIQHAYVRKNLKFKLFFFSSLFGTILSGVVGIILAYKGFGAWALIASTLTDQIVDMIVLLVTTGWFPKFVLNINSSKSIIKFGNKLLFSDILTSIRSELQSLVIGIKFTAADLAYNSKGKKFSYLPIEVANSSIRSVMLPVFSKNQDNKEKVKQIASNTIKVISYFTTPMLIGMIVTAKNFIPILLTNNWIGCIPYVQIYCFTSLFNPILITDFQIIQAYAEGNKLIKINSIIGVLDIVLILITIIFFNKPIFLAIQAIIVTIFYVLITNNACKEIIDYGIVEHFKTVKNAKLISSIMGVIVYGVGNIAISNQLLTLVIQVIVGIITYLFLSIIFKVEELEYIIKYFKK